MTLSGLTEIIIQTTCEKNWIDVETTDLHISGRAIIKLPTTCKLWKYVETSDLLWSGRAQIILPTTRDQNQSRAYCFWTWRHYILLCRTDQNICNTGWLQNILQSTCQKLADNRELFFNRPAILSR